MSEARKRAYAINGEICQLLFYQIGYFRQIFNDDSLNFTFQIHRRHQHYQPPLLQPLPPPSIAYTTVVTPPTPSIPAPTTTATPNQHRRHYKPNSLPPSPLPSSVVGGGGGGWGIWWRWCLVVEVVSRISGGDNGSDGGGELQM
nr:hypothetical protein [Tanacetum cinerariifolium]